MRIRIVALSTVIAAAGFIGPVGALAASTTAHHSAVASAERPRVSGLKVTKRAVHKLWFSARVNPEGLPTKAELIAKYQSRIVGGATRSAGSGTTATTLHFTITHLHAHRTFHVHVVATNSAGKAYSDVITARTRRKHH
jgi:hypothetical protein